jgi:methyl-accepting chemotaxis protein
MGILFPFFSLLFVTHFKSSLYFAVFFISCIAAGVCVGLISFLIGKNTIIRFIGTVAAEMREIADGEGNLTKRLEVKSDDQVGLLANHFNLFMSKLQQIIDQINSSVLVAASLTTELSAVANQLYNGTKEIDLQTSTVASSNNQLVANISSISTDAALLSSTADAVSQEINLVNDSLAEVSKSCSKELAITVEAKREIGISKQGIDRLTSAVDSISTIVNLITSISEQTNLLALNAAIEAVSVGEAGKGFAVVASEVKNLARTAGKASLSITDEIQKIRHDTQITAASISRILLIIDDMHNISQIIETAVGRQSSAIAEIAVNGTDVRTRTQSVSRNVEESARGLTAISSALESISGTIAETTSGISQIHASVEELARVSDTLKKLFAAFRV